MATIIDYNHHKEIGTFIRLTNKFALIAEGFPLNTYKEIRFELGHSFPIITTTIADCRVVGTLCAANKNGLILPYNITEEEIKNIKEQLPDDVDYRIVDERLNALGNVVLCNDTIALVQPELEESTLEYIESILNVEVIKYSVEVCSDLVGSCMVLSNRGCLVGSYEHVDELKNILDINVTFTTVNNGSRVLSSGLAVNDTSLFMNLATNFDEFNKILGGLNLARFCHYRGSWKCTSTCCRACQRNF